MQKLSKIKKTEEYRKAQKSIEKPKQETMRKSVER